MADDISDLAKANIFTKVESIGLKGMSATEHLNKSAAFYGKFSQGVFNKTGGAYDIHQVVSGRPKTRGGTGEHATIYLDLIDDARDITNLTQLVPTRQERPALFAKRALRGLFQYKQFNIRMATTQLSLARKAAGAGKRLSQKTIDRIRDRSVTDHTAGGEIGLPEPVGDHMIIRSPDHTIMDGVNSARFIGLGAARLGMTVLGALGTGYFLNSDKGTQDIILPDNATDRALGIAKAFVPYKEISGLRAAPTIKAVGSLPGIFRAIGQQFNDDPVTKAQMREYQKLARDGIIFIPASSAGIKYGRFLIDLERKLGKTFFGKENILLRLEKLTPLDVSPIGEIWRGAIESFRPPKDKLTATARLLNAGLPKTERLAWEEIVRRPQLKAFMDRMNLPSFEAFKKLKDSDINDEGKRKSMARIIGGIVNVKEFDYEGPLAKIFEIIANQNAATEEVMQGAINRAERKLFREAREFLIANRDRIGREEIKSFLNRKQIKKLSETERALVTPSFAKTFRFDNEEFKFDNKPFKFD